jgi:hypothetical protein
MGSVPNVLEGAKKALDKANNFTKSVTGNKPSAFAPEVKPRTDYSHAREARKAPGEFLGVRSNEAPEINTALASREQAKKVLDQQ